MGVIISVSTWSACECPSGGQSFAIFSSPAKNRALKFQFYLGAKDLTSPGHTGCEHMIGGILMRLRLNYPLVLVLLSGLSGCDEPVELSDFAMTETTQLPLSPTNRYADDPLAARFGHALFFDPRMSADGRVSCASCHDPDHAFADPGRVSEGAFGRVGTRHAPSLINVAFNRFQLWDGRADSLWAQPIQALEDPLEGDFTRTELAHFIAQEYGASYAQIFGPLPSLDTIPSRAKPGDRAWATMDPIERDIVNRIAANVGKAIEAFERTLTCTDTLFDRSVRGEVALSALAQRGAEIFMNSEAAGCVECHSGPNFTDGAFHNLGLDHPPGEPDRGHVDGIVALLDDHLNGMSSYSDDPVFGAERLDVLGRNRGRALGAFKTPGLRGVAQRDRFGHLGHERDLERWIDRVYDRRRVGGADPRGRGGRRGQGTNPPGDHRNFVGRLSPEFPRGVDGGEARALAAFLRTLNCPPLPAHLTRPPTGTRL
ncbi:MAG: cytochrome c peroxidase [Myxococcota bacterium]|nr:cytochrome c peroxidase [Myxococcota bacterium]